jgi:diaminohydroxyphosphoribosylaminopyrimidine deaminase/5-amino-6-(5-phosphoribosylamino)uracil reductase
MRSAWQATGATLIETPETSGHIDLKAALQTLAQKGLTRILSEGGSTVAAALVKAGLVDELAMFTGGVLIGAEGHPAFGRTSLLELSEAARPNLLRIESMGRDTLSQWSFDALD